MERLPNAGRSNLQIMLTKSKIEFCVKIKYVEDGV